MTFGWKWVNEKKDYGLLLLTFFRYRNEHSSIIIFLDIFGQFRYVYGVWKFGNEWTNN